MFRPYWAWGGEFFRLASLRSTGNRWLGSRQPLKVGLHWYGNTNAACEKDAYVHVGKSVNCSAFDEAANWPYINWLYANSFWCTVSRRIAFGCSPNVRHTAECCLPRLKSTSASNVRIIFKCRVRIRILFTFRCKHGLTVCCSSTLTVHTELCSLVLTVNCRKTEKLLTIAQLCNSFWGTGNSQWSAV